MDNQKKSRFGLGLLIGSIIGGVNRFIFCPKIRERVKRGC